VERCCEQIENNTFIAPSRVRTGQGVKSEGQPAREGRLVNSQKNIAKNWKNSNELRERINRLCFGRTLPPMGDEGPLGREDMQYLEALILISDNSE
jgi:hypothetical protein